MESTDVSPNRLPRLSKSRILAGLQCLKRLYLECYRRDLADPVDDSRQAIFDAGTAVGVLATERFPEGRLVAEQYFEHSQAVRTTERLLRNTSLPYLYEPAFTFRGVRTRVDILQRNSEGKFDLIEVKSTTGVKDVHIPDVAAQLYVVEGSGLPVDRIYLMHIDSTYVYEGGAHDLEKLFSLADVTADSRSYATERLPEAMDGMWEALEAKDAPDIETGRHCTKPYRCPFFGYCHRDEPEHPVRELPGLRQGSFERMKAAGIAGVADIPPEFPGLTETQRRARESVIAGESFVGPSLSRRLAEIEAPVSFLDFETLSPAVPLYAQTRPYQTIPFQWSLHVHGSNGTLSHSSYLHDGIGDPRQEFIASLLKSMPEPGSIVTYSSYESTLLKSLAKTFPESADELLALCDRIVDLLNIVRSEYYHPEFHGSFSIKSVLPALVPDGTYDDLEISHGAAAAAIYTRLLGDDLTTSERMRLRKALLAYCARDTEAMVGVYEALVKESNLSVTD